MYKFSKRSEKNLENVHPLLVKVVKRALTISKIDFTVVEGVRSIEKQKEYCMKGVSKTMHSYHLQREDGYGYAVDLYPYYNNSVRVEAVPEAWRALEVAMKRAAYEEHAKITWGGDWLRFVDKPHFQLEL